MTYAHYYWNSSRRVNCVLLSAAQSDFIWLSEPTRAFWSTVDDTIAIYGLDDILFLSKKFKTIMRNTGNEVYKQVTHLKIQKF